MGWEGRERGGRYYTRSRRVQGRVVREYVGGGEVGELAAALDAQERAQRAAQRRARQVEQQRLAAVAAPVEAFDQMCRLLVDLTLEEAGYHRHHRGAWRRRRRSGEHHGHD